MAGFCGAMRYFEDIPPDDRWVVGTYDLSETEIVDFARRWDPQPVHTDPVAARESVFGGLVASSAHLFAICTRLFFAHTDPIRVVAMLGKDRLRLPNPARAGTTLTYETRCMGKRDSTSRADVGIITLADRVTDDSGAIVLTQEVSLMVARRERL